MEQEQFRDLTTEEAKQVIDTAIDLGCEDIGFSGGEPFARKDIIELIEYVKDYPIHILTNGLLITEEQANYIKSIDNLLIEFRVSLDGLNAHKNLRNVDYGKVLEKIKMLVSKEFVVTVNTMVTKDSILELDTMYEMFKKIGIDRWRIDFVFNSGNANINHIDNDEFVSNFDKLKDLIVRYVKERPDFELDVNKMFRSAFLTSAKHISYSLSSKPCAYQGALTVRPNGNVSFCPSMELTCGNILKNSIEEILSSDNWKELSNIKISDLHSKCQNCKYMYFCGGGCRADSLYSCGSLYKNCDFTCKLVEYYIEKIEPAIESDLIKN